MANDNKMGYKLVEALKDTVLFHGAFHSFDNALQEFARLAGMDIEPDWTEDAGWGWITNDGREFGILPIADNGRDVEYDDD